jgi:hypothetical protein
MATSFVPKSEQRPMSHICSQSDAASVTLVVVIIV